MKLKEKIYGQWFLSIRWNYRYWITQKNSACAKNVPARNSRGTLMPTSQILSIFSRWWQMLKSVHWWFSSRVRLSSCLTKSTRTGTHADNPSKHIQASNIYGTCNMGLWQLSHNSPMIMTNIQNWITRKASSKSCWMPPKDLEDVWFMMLSIIYQECHPIRSGPDEQNQLPI
jgi:hypothetical protein